jgi:hypothetical protein
MRQTPEPKTNRFTNKQWELLRHAGEKYPLEVEIDGAMCMRSVRILNHCGFLTVGGTDRGSFSIQLTDAGREALVRMQWKTGQYRRRRLPQD